MPLAHAAHALYWTLPFVMALAFVAIVTLIDRRRTERAAARAAEEPGQDARRASTGEQTLAVEVADELQEVPHMPKPDANGRHPRGSLGGEDGGGARSAQVLPLGISPTNGVWCRSHV